MAKIAKVESIELLRQFRAALVKFAESADAALGDAESEMQRVQMWVENEQSSHWQHQLRTRQAALVKAKEALRQKQIFKDPTGARQSYVDEEKAVAIAHRRVQEAEQKLTNVKRWSRQLEKEINLYKGSVQGFATTIGADLPKAVAKIDRMMVTLQGYFAVSPTEAGSTAAESDASGAARMSRPEAGPPEPGELYRTLRRLTPSAASRESLAQGELSQAVWRVGDLTAQNLEQLAKLPLEHAAVDPNGTLSLAADVWESRRVYLERLNGAFPGDAGWHLGPADGVTPTAFVSARVADLLQVRPQWSDLLSLPPGTLIVIDAAGLAALLDGNDQNLWIEAPSSTVDPAPPTQSSVLSPQS